MAVCQVTIVISHCLEICTAQSAQESAVAVCSFEKLHRVFGKPDFQELGKQGFKGEIQGLQEFLPVLGLHQVEVPAYFLRLPQDVRHVSRHNILQLLVDSLQFIACDLRDFTDPLLFFGLRHLLLYMKGHRVLELRWRSAYLTRIPLTISVRVGHGELFSLLHRELLWVSSHFPLHFLVVSLQVARRVVGHLLVVVAAKVTLVYFSDQEDQPLNSHRLPVSHLFGSVRSDKLRKVDSRYLCLEVHEVLIESVDDLMIGFQVVFKISLSVETSC